MSRGSSSRAGSARGERAWSLARKLGAYTGLLVLLFVAIAWLVVNEVRRVDTDLAKMFEENREALLTHDLALDLAALAVPRVDAGAEPWRPLVDAARLARARATLGALAALVALRIIGPLRRLRDGAQRLGRGELSLRLVDAGRDEIGALTRDLNHMAAELEASRADLQHRVEERTRELMRAARLADLGTLAAGIAHEINNPLASIASSAEGLQRRLREGPVAPADQHEYLEVIAKEAYRVHEITQRMLAFARNEPAGRAAFRPAEALSETRRLLEHSAARRGVRVELAIDPELPLFTGVEAHWRQLVLNLLLNAIDVAPRDTSVELALRAERGQLCLDVRDRGPGVAPADRDRIFDPFFTTKQPGQGTGLGLAIVHRVVEEHGGTIEVLDAAPGALFRVRMPLEREERA